MTMNRLRYNGQFLTAPDVSGYQLYTSDTVVERVLALMGRNMTVRQLAARCAEQGPTTLTTQTLYKMLGKGRNTSKTRKPRPVTADELVTLAAALDCTTGWLLGEYWYE